MNVASPYSTSWVLMMNARPNGMAQNAASVMRNGAMNRYGASRCEYSSFFTWCDTFRDEEEGSPSRACRRRSAATPRRRRAACGLEAPGPAGPGRTDGRSPAGPAGSRPEQSRREVDEVVLPGVPAVRPFEETVELVVDAHAVEGLHGGDHGVVGEVRDVAVVHPQQNRPVVDRLDVEGLRITGVAGGEGPHIAELARPAGQHLHRLSTSHRQSGQSSPFGLAADVELFLGSRGDVLEQLGGEVTDVAVTHHHDHRLEVPVQEVVVEDVLRLP